MDTFTIDILFRALPLLLAAGAAGGFLSGLLGIGGGLVFVPALYYCFGLTGSDTDHAMHAAVGTSLALVMVTGAVSAYWHDKKAAVDFYILRSWGPFAAFGAAVGAYFAAAIDGAVLAKIFAGAMFLVSIYMMLSREGDPDVPQKSRLSTMAARVISLAIGAAAAMIGVGGAILTIPMMTYSGIPLRKAVGTGAALGAVISIPGIAGYIVAGLHRGDGLPPFSLGYINLPAVALIVPFCFLLSPVGVRVSHGLDKKILKRIFAIVLLFASLRMFFA
jgi:hypothetical protein